MYALRLSLHANRPIYIQKRYILCCRSFYMSFQMSLHFFFAVRDLIIDFINSYKVVIRISLLVLKFIQVYIWFTHMTLYCMLKSDSIEFRFWYYWFTPKNLGFHHWLDWPLVIFETRFSNWYKFFTDHSRKHVKTTTARDFSRSLTIFQLN